MRWRMKYIKLRYRILSVLFFVYIVITAGVTSCFAVPVVTVEDSYDDYDDYDDYENKNTEVISDPFEKLNRKIFDFNIYLLDNVIEPASDTYEFFFPKFFRERFNNFGDRFYDPIVLFNSLLQLDFKNSFKTVATFATNVTLGIFGLFNPAKHFGFYRERRTLGETLGFYGIKNGFYIMIPFVGPSTLRNGFGMAGDFFINPLGWNGTNFWDDRDLTPDRLEIPKYIGKYAPQLETAVGLNKQFLQKSFDPYIFTRESYLQNVIYKQSLRKR